MSSCYCIFLEPVQRKTREEIDDKIETTDQQSVTTDNPLSVNRLPEDQNRQSEDQGKFHVKPIEDVKQSLNKRKVKKHLEKKLKTLIKIVKTLKMIKRENSVQIGLYEFETTAEFRLTAKQMLGSCKQFMKENPRESQIKKKKFENSMAIPFQKMLVDKLLELTWQYKQNLPVAETVDCSLNNTTSMQHKLSNEDSDLTKLCKENDMDGKFDSDTCITKTDKFHENIQSIDFKNISCVDPIDAGSKIKRKRNRSRNNRSKKKKEKTIKENNDLEKVGSVPVDDRVETKKSQHQALESSHQEDFEQRTKSGKKKKSKNKCVSIGENASGPDSVLKQKRKQAAETEVPQKKRKIKCDKIQEKNHKKKRGNKESKLHMPKQKRNIIK